ncbi:MAG: orotate phosphoribosyltransferase [Oscillospiraceae bacterium]|nr:orotate phosphoribosyltransferase [Oscillospiraceae bacterium]
MSNNKVFYPQFLDFMVKSGALLFGDFTLKSGRKSPYFINTGEYSDGEELAILGSYYAKLIHNSVRESPGGIDEHVEQAEIDRLNLLIAKKFNVLYGPAYKGITLVSLAGAALASKGLNLYFSFNRKERKTHGDESLFFGHTPENGDKIAIVEDVTTAGTSVRETIAILKELGIDARITSLYISVDRMERGTHDISATQELQQEYGIDVHSIATTYDIIAYLENPACTIPEAAKHADAMREYLKLYGAKQL